MVRAMRAVSWSLEKRIRGIRGAALAEEAPMGASQWTTLLQGWGASVLVLQALWFVQRRHKDAGLADVGWAGSLAALAIWYAVVGEGSGAQRLLAGIVGGLWGGRLALHLLFDRCLGKPEDGRYAYLREHWGERADVQFLWFFQLQALVAALLSVPFLLMAGNPAEALLPVQWFGLALFVLAKGGEVVADRQLARFRARPDSRGRTCREGLWRYSRHPNYFFEWLVWCTFAALAWPAPGGPWALAMPVLMYVLITKVSGIPYTEAQALRSRGEDYRRYQRTTSPLIPWFPREEHA